MKIPAFLLLLLLAASPICFAQKAELLYQPKNLDSIQKYIADITVKKSKDFNGDYQKEILKTLNERKDYFIKGIKDSSYIFDSRINNYFKGILSEIYRANPEIDHTDFYFFIDKSPVPNAACYGNGIFTINLGLFDVFDSDDEMAFTICHEMAHYKLKHLDKSLLEYLSKTKSKETKKQISQAAHKQYGARRALTEVVKSLEYNFLRRKRSMEVQADSLGYRFLSKTKYNKGAAYSSLKKLGLCDTLLFRTDTKIRQHFNFDDYPFKEEWLSPDETLFDLKEASDDYAFNKDSIKTHPDIPYRLQKIKEMYPEETVLQPSPALMAMKKLVSGNNIAVSLDASRVDMALYQVLTQYEQKEIDEKTYAKTVAYLLKRTYDLKLNHQFGKYVGPVSPFSEEKYLNEIRLFLNHIELKNTRKIGIRFCQKYQSLLADDKDFNSILQFFTNLNIN